MNIILVLYFPYSRSALVGSVSYSFKNKTLIFGTGALKYFEAKIVSFMLPGIEAIAIRT